MRRVSHRSENRGGIKEPERRGRGRRSNRGRGGKSHLALHGVHASGIEVDRHPCVIIGAGPAGLAAALTAAHRGHAVIVLEKNSLPGRKLLLAGGGRANLIDPDVPAHDAVGAYGRSGRFLHQALAAFRPAEFFRRLGVETECVPDGPRRESVYARGGARRLLDALLVEAEMLGVELIVGAVVGAVVRLPDGNFDVRAAEDTWKCRRLIVATGGMTYPSTGSTGDGYAWAEAFGHEVDPPRPALGALATAPRFPRLAGVAVADASVTLRRKGRKAATRRGALLFTHRGVSGPPVLDLSLDLAQSASTPTDIADARLDVDLSPEMSREEVLDEIRTGFSARPRRRLLRAGLMPRLPGRLVSELVRHVGIPEDRHVGEVSRAEFAALAQILKVLALKVTAAPDPREAVVTLGGVATKDLDPRTMESRLVPGLHFAGEVLAPAGPCGGFNLLMAFATGAAAGQGVGNTSS